MKKLMEIRKKMKNNKGFSLVELIIVIAIMAVLVAVLAPQFLKYVEKSRNATDAQNATAIVSALQTYYADPDATDLPASGSTATITVSSTGTACDTDPNTFLDNAYAAAGITKDTNCKSKSTWTSYTIKYTVTNGTIDITYGTAGDKFNLYMTKGTTS